MAFKAKLVVAGKERNILSVDYGMLQETDASGRPSSISRGGKIHITVESTGDTDLFEWMTNSFERKDGSIVFLKRDSEATLKELKFKEAYIYINLTRGQETLLMQAADAHESAAAQTLELEDRKSTV